MQCRDSHHAVKGAEPCAAGREFGDRGWSAAGSPEGLPEASVDRRVSPAHSGWELPRAEVILSAVADARLARFDLDIPPGTQRPAVGVVVGMRS